MYHFRGENYNSIKEIGQKYNISRHKIMVESNDICLKILEEQDGELCYSEELLSGLASRLNGLGAVHAWLTESGHDIAYQRLSYYFDGYNIPKKHDQGGRDRFFKKLAKTPNIKVLTEYKTCTDDMDFYCETHNHKFTYAPWRYNGCHYCKNSNRFCTAMQEIADHIKTIYDGDILVNFRKEIYPLELDLYIPELKIAVEYNGDYYHRYMGDEYSKYRHKEKHDICFNRGIRLIQIPEHYYHSEPSKVFDLLLRAIKGTETILDVDAIELNPMFDNIDMYLKSGYKLVECKEVSLIETSSYQVYDAGRVVVSRVEDSSIESHTIYSSRYFDPKNRNGQLGRKRNAATKKKQSESAKAYARTKYPLFDVYKDDKLVLTDALKTEIRDYLGVKYQVVLNIMSGKASIQDVIIRPTSK